MDRFEQQAMDYMVERNKMLDAAPFIVNGNVIRATNPHDNTDMIVISNMGEFINIMYYTEDTGSQCHFVPHKKGCTYTGDITRYLHSEKFDEENETLLIAAHEMVKFVELFNWWGEEN